MAAADGDRVIRRPIISMEQYVAGIPRDGIKRRNVVMVQIESLRSDQLRAYGGTRDVMPAVDALARESRVFTNAYIQASHSNYAGPGAVVVALPAAFAGDVPIPAEPNLSARAHLRRAEGPRVQDRDLLLPERALGRNDQLPPAEQPRPFLPRRDVHRGRPTLPGATSDSPNGSGKRRAPAASTTGTRWTKRSSGSTAWGASRSSFT